MRKRFLKGFKETIAKYKRQNSGAFFGELNGVKRLNIINSFINLREPLPPKTVQS